MRNKKRPNISPAELERMLSILTRCEQEGRNPAPKTADLLREEVAPILTMYELKGHYGHCAPHELVELSYSKVWDRSVELKRWITRWLGRERQRPVRLY